MTAPDFEGTIVERLERWSVPEPNTGCLLWIGALSTNGQPEVWHDGRQRKARRVAYELVNGQTRDQISQLCRIASCINVRHMSAVVNSSRGRCKPGLEAVETPTVAMIAWAAGLFEGEGTALVSTRTTKVMVAQKDDWILKRLRALFGGKISQRTGPSSFGIRLIHNWTISGARARGFLMTIYGFLSPWRKEQARRALDFVS